MNSLVYEHGESYLYSRRGCPYSVVTRGGRQITAQRLARGTSCRSATWSSWWASVGLGAVSKRPGLGRAVAVASAGSDLPGRVPLQPDVSASQPSKSSVPPPLCKFHTPSIRTLVRTCQARVPPPEGGSAPTVSRPLTWGLVSGRTCMIADLAVYLPRTAAHRCRWVMRWTCAVGTLLLPGMRAAYGRSADRVVCRASHAFF